MADGIYAKLLILNRPVQKDVNLPGFFRHLYLNLDHFSQLESS